MVKKTDIALLLGLGIVGFILFSQLKNIQFPSFQFPSFQFPSFQFPSFQFPRLPSISETVSTTQKLPSITSDILSRFDPNRSISPILELERLKQQAPIFQSVSQGINKIISAITPGFSTEFFERVGAISPVTQSGQFVQKLDAFGRPIRSF